MGTTISHKGNVYHISVSEHGINIEKVVISNNAITRFSYKIVKLEDAFEVGLINNDNVVCTEGLDHLDKLNAIKKFKKAKPYGRAPIRFD